MPKGLYLSVFHFDPAAQIVEKLSGRKWVDDHVTGLVVPVSTAGLYEFVRANLIKHRPDVWLGLGVGATGSVIQPEVIAVNWRHFSVPDVDGAKLDMVPIFENGPDAYNAGLPNQRITQALNAAGIPARLSFHAGTHLCNQMLYTVAHQSRALQMNVRCGFIHVPQTPENIAKALPDEVTKSSMSLAMMTEAISQSLAIICEDFVASAGKAAQGGQEG